MPKQLKFAPREVFEQILEFAVIPTFDLVIILPKGGVVIVKRKIAPYANQWALPGLRMFKPESIEETLLRVARAELGLKIQADERIFLGQYVGRFKTEHERQDISTGYAVAASAGDITLNIQHFTTYAVIGSASEIPRNMGAMYRYYLRNYFARGVRGK
ncbi:MAG: NUDIX domain-containing protein [Candidatus Zixiibacteriota bacterium]